MIPLRRQAAKQTYKTRWALFIDVMMQIDALTFVSVQLLVQGLLEYAWRR
jgi:hypothetical protein